MTCQKRMVGTVLHYNLKVLCPICRPENENVKFQRHLKDDTNLELPSKRKYTVAHKVGIFSFYPNLWNYFKNNLKIIDLDNSIHSLILLNNNLPMSVLRDCLSMCMLLCLSTRGPTPLSHK